METRFHTITPPNRPPYPIWVREMGISAAAHREARSHAQGLMGHCGIHLSPTLWEEIRRGIRGLWG